MSDPWAPPCKIDTPVGSVGDNIFIILATVRSFVKQLEWPMEWFDQLHARIEASDSYDAALEIVQEHFTLRPKED